MSKHARAAKAFALRAKLHTTYYAIATHHELGGPTQLLTEIVFNQKHPLDGTPCRGAAFTAEGAFLRDGPLYEDREHRDIRHIPTLREYERFRQKFGEAFEGSVDAEVRRFRSGLRLT